MASSPCLTWTSKMNCELLCFLGWFMKVHGFCGWWVDTNHEPLVFWFVLISNWLYLLNRAKINIDGFEMWSGFPGGFFFCHFGSPYRCSWIKRTSTLLLKEQDLSFQLWLKTLESCLLKIWAFGREGLLSLQLSFSCVRKAENCSYFS